MLGWPEIIGILVVVLVLFGAKKIPELAKGLGSGIKEFKKASREIQDDLQRAVEEEPPPPPRKPAPPAESVPQSGDAHKPSEPPKA
ncbi:MAG: twin-arginine translocase TatA/TatE family subunit [Verrucomicrobia bacterium]|nr:twin-arginine translocase TatA/TatE family subunit [Verrucomicrobiota bacterium]MBI3871364.1 twin-arginine translocase TatA/TatE family subunit [Verrucomicrobiota bacterium]